MKPDIVDLNEVRIVVVKGECNMATTLQDIPPLWIKLMANASLIKNIVGKNVAYGVSTMIDSENFWNVACFEVSMPEDVPKWMVSEVVPSMRIAKFTHTGKMETLKDTYAKIMAEWMPLENLEIDWTKPSIEMYDERFKEGSDDSICEIWMPIK